MATSNIYDILYLKQLLQARCHEDDGCIKYNILKNMTYFIRWCGGLQFFDSAHMNNLNVPV